MKVCIKCETELPLSEFHKNKGSADGHHSTCKHCKNAATRYRYSTTPEYNREKARRYHLKNRTSDEYKHKRRERHLLSTYGLTISDVEAMLDSQGNSCACCGKEITATFNKREAVVDHDHNTGHVRGVLCYLCNTGIGALGDNIEGVEKAMEYLRRRT